MNGLVDKWIVGLRYCAPHEEQIDQSQSINPIIGKNPNWVMDYAKRRNLNRGYMKLEAWQRAMDLFVMAFRLSSAVSDFKLKSQFRDAAQSVSANLAEGYGRRSLAEYLQYLYTAKGSLAEALTRAIGLRGVELISTDDFEGFDKLHYEVENKLLRLIESLENKRGTNDWSDSLPPAHQSINPLIH